MTVLFIASWSPTWEQRSAFHTLSQIVQVSFEIEWFQAEQKLITFIFRNTHTQPTQLYVACPVERLLLLSLALLWSDEFSRTFFSMVPFLERKYSICNSVHPSIFPALRRSCIERLLPWYELLRRNGRPPWKNEAAVVCFLRHALKIWSELHN